MPSAPKPPAWPLEPRAAAGGGWRAWRDALLASPRFQRWASAFPLTRPIARRQAGELFDLVAGFVYSQVLAACVRIDLFERLAGGPLEAAEVARHAGLPEEGARRLLEAAAALRLVERRGGRWGLGPRGAALRAQPGVMAMVAHHGALYADLADPLALLRERGARATALGRYWAYADRAAPTELPEGRVADYSALMSASQPMVAGQILDAYPLARHRRLLDVGGGEGRFLVEAARRAPALSLMLFDLPAVAARAAQRFEAEGLAGRAQAFGGDFRAGGLPGGADIAILCRVVHDHDDAAVAALLRAVREALPPDGHLLIAEPFAETPGAEAMGAAYFGFYLLAMGQGRPRTPAELTRMLEAAGFERVRTVPTAMPLLCGLLHARVSTKTLGQRW